jgi:uncharacterized protein YqeY
MLIDTIRSDMTEAMKARDNVTLRTLRAVIAAVQEAEVAGTEAKQLSDDEVLKIVAAQAKRRTEAAEAFEAGGAADRAADERAEQTVLEGYLPAALSDSELEELVARSLAEGGWTTKADMGQAMKAINAEVAGRADGRRVADLVKASLAG